MLRLANASKTDIFYDLGCGRAQPCVIAVCEFGVKRAVGIELHKGRAKKAKRYVRRLGLSSRIEIRNENFLDSDLSDATMVYCGLTENDDDFLHCEKRLRNGCKFLMLSLPLVGVMPNVEDYPFYLMQTPFKKTRKITDWIFAVLSKKATVGEFFEELANDRDYLYDRRALRNLIRNRFDSVAELNP